MGVARHLIPKRIRRRPVAVLAKLSDYQSGGRPLYPPVAVGGTEYRDVGTPVAVIIGRYRYIGRGPKLVDGICRTAAVCDKPLARRRPEDGDVGLAVAVVIGMRHLVGAKTELVTD